jgi:hypothetical protein
MDQIRVRDCATVLQMLANARDQYRHGAELDLPSVSVHIRSGKEFSGYVLNLGSSGQSQILLLEISEEGVRYPQPKVAYIAVNDIDAVEVADAAKFAQLLSFGEANLVPQTPPPTRLDIKRKLTRASALVGDLVKAPVAFDVDWESIPQNNEYLRQLANSISDVTCTLGYLADDLFNRAEIAKKVRTVRLRSGSELAVSAKNGLLLVSVKFDSKRDPQALQQLREAVKKAL